MPAGKIARFAVQECYEKIAVVALLDLYGNLSTSTPSEPLRGYSHVTILLPFPEPQYLPRAVNWSWALNQIAINVNGAFRRIAIGKRWCASYRIDEAKDDNAAWVHRRLTFALSGAPLHGASALERGVRRHHFHHSGYAVNL